MPNLVSFNHQCQSKYADAIAVVAHVVMCALVWTRQNVPGWRYLTKKNEDDIYKAGT